MNKQDRKNRWALTFLFSFVVFCVLISAILLSAAVLWVLIKLELFAGTGSELRSGQIIVFMVLISIVIGSAIAVLLGKVPLSPINLLINQMNGLASGNFKLRLKFGKALSNHPTFNELSDSFNRLAEELQNTEMLRSDFVNNFSHEFKTPIVSIAGFAKLLNKGNLTEEERRQYLSAIEQESMRLSYMATNVLNLTKVENQAILTDVSAFNMSEQIRSAVLLLEEKWVRKEIDLQLDFDEYTINANEELLKQIWINLLDNAIKFSPQGGTVSVGIREEGEDLIVSVGNTGAEIAPEDRQKIFHKFYQVDKSHSTEGNGIGLAIVKRIVDLHRGKIFVESADGKTVFWVHLPKAR